MPFNDDADIMINTLNRAIKNSINSGEILYQASPFSGIMSDTSVVAYMNVATTIMTNIATINAKMNVMSTLMAAVGIIIVTTAEYDAVLVSMGPSGIMVRVITAKNAPIQLIIANVVPGLR